MGAQWKAKGKALVADAKGRLFGKLVKEIIVAARSGADPAGNSRLRLAVEAARKASMPKDTLERAIKKGSGVGGEAVHYEHVIYEGFAPHQVPVMVECLTDNVNRTAPEMRVCFRKGQMSAVAWDFDHVGMIEGEPAQLPAVVESAIYRIAQEALTNCVKHATGARNLTVHLSFTKGSVVLTVADDGAGFVAPDTDRHGGRGQGVRGMRQRMTSIGGTLEIESGECGTKVTATARIVPEPMRILKR